MRLACSRAKLTKKKDTGVKISKTVSNMIVILDDILRDDGTNRKLKKHEKCYRDLIFELLHNIISVFFINNKNADKRSLKSMVFIKRMDELYSVSRTSDKHIIRIKEILDHIMESYKNESATRTAIFYYFVFYIAKYS